MRVVSVYMYLSDSTGTLLIIEVDGSFSSSSSVMTLSPAHLRMVTINRKLSEVYTTKKPLPNTQM